MACAHCEQEARKKAMGNYVYAQPVGDLKDAGVFVMGMLPVVVLGAAVWFLILKPKDRR